MEWIVWKERFEKRNKTLVLHKCYNSFCSLDFKLIRLPKSKQCGLALDIVTWEITRHL